MTPENILQVSPGPHLWRGVSTRKIMLAVTAALMFPTAAAIYYFGYYAIIAIATSVITSVLTEYVVKKLRGRPYINDGSAVVTGLLLALTLPPTINPWMVAIGAVFAIAIVKEAFGGLGHNIFNPALGGRAFLVSSFGVKMTTWVLPMNFAVDAVTTATPLSERFVFSWRLAARLALYKDMFLGNIGGSLGETSALAIIIGGILLIVFRIIDWRIPLTYLGTVAVFSLALGDDPIFHLLAGGLMLGAFFMATDYVTSPITPKGRIIFGIGCGVVTAAIRAFGGLPEGVCYSILLMNAVTPLIDRYILTKPFGLVKVAKS